MPKTAHADPTTIAALTRDPQNRRRHPDRNLKMIADALLAVGPARSIVIDEHDTILAGEGVTHAAQAVGFTKVRVVEADGDELIAVRRRGLSEDQKRALALFDNRAGELSEWNYEQLEADKTAGLTLQPFWTDDEVQELASRASANEIDAIARQPSAGDTSDAPTATEETHTFFCSLTTDQERIVRAAVRAARARYHVETTGDALTAALQAWADAQKEAN